MKKELNTRWNTLMGNLKFPANTKMCEEIINQLDCSRRPFSNLSLLKEKLDLFDNIDKFPARPYHLELAIWFSELHPQLARKYTISNALRLNKFLKENEVDKPSEYTQVLHCSSFNNKTTESFLLEDINLAVFAQKKYKNQIKNIKKEYQILYSNFEEMRKIHLIELLEKPKLFHSTLYFPNKEKEVRDNLKMEMKHYAKIFKKSKI